MPNRYQSVKKGCTSITYRKQKKIKTKNIYVYKGTTDEKHGYSGMAIIKIYVSNDITVKSNLQKVRLTGWTVNLSLSKIK